MPVSYPIITISALILLGALAVQPLAAQAQSATGARPGNDIGTRDSLPLSPYASNISSGDMTSTIAPTAPEPKVGPNADVAELLAAGKQALAAGQTGTTEEALEQAETQILMRALPHSETDYSSQDPTVTAIDQARTALGSGDKAGTLQKINEILASGSPELSD